MNLKTKWLTIAGSAIAASALLAGAAFAAGAPANPAPAPAPTAKVQAAVKAGKLTQAEADLIQQVRQLQQTKMAKVQADAKALVDQAVKDGKLTQAQADQLLQSHKGGRKPGAAAGSKHWQGKHKELPGQEEQDDKQGPAQEGQNEHKHDGAQLKTRLDAQVKAGKLTQNQADVMLQVSQLRQQAEQQVKAEAKALVAQAVKDGKITQAQAHKLFAHRQHGFEGNRLTQDQLKAKLDAAVKAGKLTQAKADQMLQRFAQRQQKQAAPQAPATGL